MNVHSNASSMSISVKFNCEYIIRNCIVKPGFRDEYKVRTEIIILKFDSFGERLLAFKWRLIFVTVISSVEVMPPLLKGAVGRGYTVGLYSGVIAYYN